MIVKKRIAIVVSNPIQHFCPQYVSFPQHPGIVCNVFFASTLGLKKYVDPNFKQEISWGNVQLDKFDHEFINGDVVLPITSQLDAPGLPAALSAFKPDVVITYGYIQKLQRRAHRWARKNGVKLAYVSDSEKRQHRSPWKEIIKYPFLRWYFSQVDFFLSIGNANEAFYQSYGVPMNKIVRMHYPIDIVAYKKAYTEKPVLRDVIRSKYGIGKDEVVASVVGKLVPWKNQDHIIDALRVLEAEGVFLHVFIIGSGDKMEEWREKARGLQKSKVYFTGFVGIEDLPAYYAATDMYIHPASVEPHSVAISEAIAMGCTIVLSDRCGSYGETDDVQVGVNGYVFPFGDIAALAATIKKLCNREVLLETGVRSHHISAGFQHRSHAVVIDDLIALL